jgi:hypothetical protein
MADALRFEIYYAGLQMVGFCVSAPHVLKVYAAVRFSNPTIFATA